MKKLLYTLLVPVILLLSSCNTSNFFNFSSKLKTISRACKSIAISTVVDKNEEIEVQETETAGFDRRSLLLPFFLSK